MEETILEKVIGWIKSRPLWQWFVVCVLAGVIIGTFLK